MARMKPAGLTGLAAALAALVVIGLRVGTTDPVQRTPAVPSSGPLTAGESPKHFTSSGTYEHTGVTLPEIDLGRARTWADLPPDPEGMTIEGTPTRPDMTNWAIDGVDAAYDKCRACILDPLAPPLKKASALRFLNDGGPSRMEPEIVHAVANLLDTTTDPKVRAALCWGLIAVDTDEAVEALLRRLRVDVDDLVREWAVNALQCSRMRENVRSALVHAGRFDASERVRESARQIIGEPD